MFYFESIAERNANETQASCVASVRPSWRLKIGGDLAQPDKLSLMAQNVPPHGGARFCDKM